MDSGLLASLGPRNDEVVTAMQTDHRVIVSGCGPVGAVSSTLIKAGMNLIGPRAGLRYPDEVPSYLNNLFRLGLVWLSREQIADPMEYQVLEAQPDVLEAMHSVRAHKVVRRSIHLTPFGEDFCRAVLVPPESHAGLPTHGTPNSDDQPPSAG